MEVFLFIYIYIIQVKKEKGKEFETNSTLTVLYKRHTFLLFNYTSVNPSKPSGSFHL